MTENKEKILVYIAIAIIIVITIVVIGLIWGASISNVDDNSINNFDPTITYEEVMTDYYKEYLAENLKLINYDILYENINPDFITSVNCNTKEELKDYLRNNNLISSDINIQNIEYSNDNSDNSYYRVTYIVHNITKYVNITESSPYNFLISFEQNNFDSINNNINANVNYDSVNFDLKVIENNDTSVKYSITITNNSNDNYQFDFLSLNNVSLRYDNNKYTNMAVAVATSNEDYTITPGSSKSFEVLFNLDFSNQMKINGIRFANVKINQDTTSIEISF